MEFNKINYWFQGRRHLIQNFSRKTTFIPKSFKEGDIYSKKFQGRRQLFQKVQGRRHLFQEVYVPKQHVAKYKTVIELL